MEAEKTERVTRHVYRVIREDFFTGQRGKKAKTYITYEPLSVGGLYMDLGSGFPGAQRILSVQTEDANEN